MGFEHDFGNCKVSQWKKQRRQERKVLIIYKIEGSNGGLKTVEIQKGDFVLRDGIAHEISDVIFDKSCVKRKSIRVKTVKRFRVREKILKEAQQPYRCYSPYVRNCKIENTGFSNQEREFHIFFYDRERYSEEYEEFVGEGFTKKELNVQFLKSVLPFPSLKLMTSAHANASIYDLPYYVQKGRVTMYRKGQ